MIPKIIHQTAPSDKSKWHPIWETCQKSWQDNFSSPEYDYKFWNDDDLLNLIQTEFPDYLQLYTDFGKNTILKVDFARYAILYKYGGIYADMDFMCKKNFYTMLHDNLIIVESSALNEVVQNSLMASPSQDSRWLAVLEDCKKYYYQFINENPTIKITGKYVIDITGPRLLSRALDMKTIQMLPKKLFNPYCNQFNSEDIYTKHFGTGKWGPSAGIKQFTNLRETDHDLNKFYNSLDLNYNLNNIPEGYLVLECGKHNTNQKEIVLSVPINDNTKVMIMNHPYQDKFITNIKDNKLIMKRINGWGWGYNHHLYLKTDVENFKNIKNVDRPTCHFKMKISKSKESIKIVKTSVPLPENTLFMHSLSKDFKIILIDATHIRIERLDTNIGWSNDFWIHISTELDGKKREYKTYKINRSITMKKILLESGWREAQDNEEIDFSYWDNYEINIPEASICVYPRSIINQLDNKKTMFNVFKSNNLTSFLPKTYIDLQNIDVNIFDKDKLFFLKDTGASGNKGVYVIKSKIEMDNIIKNNTSRYILQEEVENMYLHDGKKCMIRAYGLILNSTNYLYNDAKFNIYKKKYSRVSTDNSIHNDEYPRSVDGVPLSSMDFHKVVLDKMISICKHFDLFFRDKYISNRFIILGIDFILNKNKDPILLEVNIFPNLVSIPVEFDEQFTKDVLNLVVYGKQNVENFKICTSS